MLFLHNAYFVISFAQFAHVSPSFNHTPSIKDGFLNGSKQIAIALAPEVFRAEPPTALNNAISIQHAVSRETKNLSLGQTFHFFLAESSSSPLQKQKIELLCNFFAIADSLSLLQRDNSHYTAIIPAFFCFNP